MASTGYIEIKSVIHSLDARTKLISMLVIVFCVLYVTNLLPMAALLLLVLVAWYFAKVPFETIKGIFKYFLGIAVFVFIFQLIFAPGETVLFRYSKPIDFLGLSGYISLEAIMHGLALVLRLVVIMAVAPLLIMVTPLSEMMLGLIKLKVPYRFAFIMTTALSLLPSIQNRTHLIRQAQLCRGVADFENSNMFVRLKAFGAVLIPMILGSFRDSQTLDVAMSSRAFGAPIKRTFLLESRFQRNDYIVFLIMAASVAGSIALNILI